MSRRERGNKRGQIRESREEVERIIDGRVIWLSWPAWLQLNERNVLGVDSYRSCVTLSERLPFRRDTEGDGGGSHYHGSCQGAVWQLPLTGFNSQTHPPLSSAIVGDKTGSLSKRWMERRRKKKKDFVQTWTVRPVCYFRKLFSNGRVMFSAIITDWFVIKWCGRAQRRSDEQSGM